MPHRRRSLLVLLVSCLAFVAAHAALHLPQILSDGAVLQRGEPIPIYGWAAPGEAITVTLGDASLQTRADDDGRWSVRFDPREAGGPIALRVAGDYEVLVHDILIGDVWLCSGQSNMELPMRRVRERFEEEIATSKNSRIRSFTVPIRYEFNHPWEDIAGGQWVSADPATVLHFSAVAYFFAREIEAAEDVPVGILLSAMGGSPIESWMSEESLQAFPARLAVADPFRDEAYITGLKTAENAASAAWFRYRDAQDEGLHHQPAYYDPDYDDSGWTPFTAPGFWDEQGIEARRGVVWFRREVEVPAALAGKPGMLHLGTLVDADTTYLNGQEVGNTGYQYPPRHYSIPAGLLQAGRNVIAIRLTSTGNRGSFVRDKTYALEVDGQSLPLTGTWLAKVGMVCGPQPPSTFIQWQPLALYNAMMAPLHRQPIKGVLWYQGESNTGRSNEYEALLEAMIADWRARWDAPELPFLIVQLANFMEASESPQESGWAELREAQRLALSVPHTGMAVAIDVGEWNDIHPLDKQTVAHRLALQARKLAFGESSLLASGPDLLGGEVHGDKVLLHFTSTGEGLQTSDGRPLGQFALAGADGVFHWAEARIVDSTTIELSQREVPAPVAVRYAWAHNPEGANLVNSAGLPASPFQWSAAAE